MIVRVPSWKPKPPTNPLPGLIGWISNLGFEGGLLLACLVALIIVITAVTVKL
jgi:hypothetical protein